MKMIKFLTVGLIIAFPSCSLFLSEDLSGGELEIISPKKDTLYSEIVNFWWEEFDGVEQYELLIVSPNFGNIKSLVLDTLLNSNKIDVFLPEGKYEWRLKGINFSSETELYQGNIIIDTFFNLNYQFVHPIFPLANSYTNNINLKFHWFPISPASSYRLQIAYPNFQNGGIIFDTIIQDNSLQKVLSEDRYEWRIKASNSFTNTNYSTFFLTIDTTKPGTPQIISPIIDTIANPVYLSWNSDARKKMDSLIFYSDSLLKNKQLEYSANNNSFKFSGIPGQGYYWHVKSIDSAGNVSSNSKVGYFVVQ